ncbi:lasso peptide biosynthesis B2 protein [Acidipila sp. EB88]|uniref:lasso peptide biosynthesis B2 protein n=1 Tax=Acidipila sp. EB88 TaxID=2305226 RepID=UPI000F5E1126|nr:lasso peptide biosynthesis B2 protein [Acidipila sp. EB88]
MAVRKRRGSLLSPRRWLLLAESLVALACARVGLRCMQVAALSATGCRVCAKLRIDSQQISPQQAREAAAWVHRASRLIPGTQCLPQALATQWLVARRGGFCTLHVGVARRDSAFRSHAWATMGDAVLIGGGNAPRLYREILRVEGAAPAARPDTAPAAWSR